MKPIGTFSVIPSLPAPIERLRNIAYNLRWDWSHDSIGLFRRLDRNLWETSGHNPVLMLGTIEQEKLEAVSRDDAFLAHLDHVSDKFESYLRRESSWFQRFCRDKDDKPLIAYFSAEFGLAECLSIFAGGLGILAGDHLKSASDLGIPLIGVGLLYQQGYFRQYLNQAGWQQESYEDNDFHNLPITPVRQPDRALEMDGASRAKAPAAWIARLRQEWQHVRIEAVEQAPAATLAVGTKVQVRTSVQLGLISPEEVAVEFYLGRLNPGGGFIDAISAPMNPVGKDSRGNYLFEAATPCARSGLHGFTFRVRPQHPDLSVPFVPGLICWADGALSDRSLT